MASHADFQTDWEGLVTAAQENAANLPTAEPHRVVMEGFLGDFKTTKALQNTHRAGKQKATQDLKDILTRGKEMAIRLRGAIKADLGLKSEELVHYGILPARPRARRSVAATPTPTPTPAPVPHTTTSIGPAPPEKTNP
jgi:hypothetical protein